jgi:hypothetical protein
MRGKVIAQAPDYSLATASAADGAAASGKLTTWVLPLIGLCLLLSTGVMVARFKKG